MAYNLSIGNNLKYVVKESLREYSKKESVIAHTQKAKDIKFKEEYQGKIIDCMVGEIDDNYIETPLTDAPIVKLENSREGLVKVPSIKGKTILVDADGNETDTPAEGCKLVSVGEEEDNKLIILSNNKNLFKEEEIISKSNNTYRTITFDKKIIVTNIENYNYMNEVVGKIVLNKGVYTWSTKNIEYTNVKSYVLLELVNEKYTNIRIAPNGTTKTTFEVLDNNTIFDIRIDTGGHNAKGNVFKFNIQLETNNKETDYIKHKSHKTEILLNEPLRSLPNGVCDEIIGNKLIRKIGKVTIDGSENLRVDGGIQHNGYAQVFDGHSLFEKKGLHKNKVYKNPQNKDINIMCNRIRPSGKFGSGVEEVVPCVFAGDTSNYCMFVKFHKDNFDFPQDGNTTTFASLSKQWLAENPIEVLYELEEPIIEELPNGITLQGFDDTTMYLENKITPTVQYGYNALIPFKEEIKTQKEEVEFNTSDIEENIIPYLMDVEFNLMMMEDM